MDKAELGVFFSLLKEKKKSFEENYQYFAPQLAPKFNSFNYIRPNENGLSEIIADLLNPKGLHEQGTIFLEEFLKIIGCDEVFSNYDNQDFKIICESKTHLIEESKRRIDIEINFGRRFGIGIENKPHAWEQYNQLNDYANQLEAKFPTIGDNKDDIPGNWILIYLLGYEGTPESINKYRLEKLKATGKFIQIYYSEITEWLRHCREKCRSDKVRVFIQDFIEHCEQRFNLKQNLIGDTVTKDFIISTKENLKLSIEVASKINEAKDNLFIKFSNQLYNRLVQELPEYEIEKWENILPNRIREIPFKIFKKEWVNYYIAIEFEANQCKYPYWCVKKINSKKPRLDDIVLDEIVRLTNLKKHMNTQGVFLWAWYDYFPEPYYDWSSKSQPWEDILGGGGTLLDMVTKNIILVAKALDASNTKL